MDENIGYMVGVSDVLDLESEQLVIEFASNKERELWRKWWLEIGKLDFRAWCNVVEEEIADEQI